MPSARPAIASAKPTTALRHRCARRSRAVAPADHSNGMLLSPHSSRCRSEYAAWLDVLPDALRDSATGEALQEIVDLDLVSPGGQFQMSFDI